jgi:hypothetical protein
MKRAALALAVMLLVPTVPAPASAGHKGAKVASDGRPKGFNAKTVERHLRDHQRYPATKAQILAECENLSEFTDSDRKWFTDKLPDRSYGSPEAVLEAIGLMGPAKR